MSDKPAAMSPVKVVVIVLAAILVIGFAVLSQGQAGSTAGAQPSATVSIEETDDGVAAEATASEDAQATAEEQNRQFLLQELPRREEGDPMAKGRVDATIVMTEWADYRCPYCSVFNEETLPQLQSYVDDGTLRIEFRDMALFGDDSVFAATAARAAGQQGRYFEFQSALFAALPNEGHPDVTEELVTSIAEDLGLDLDAFAADLADPALAQAVVTQTQESQAMGLGSVPAFVIGDTYFTGAQPLEYFISTIEAQVRQLA